MLAQQGEHKALKENTRHSTDSSESTKKCQLIWAELS